MVDWVLKLIIYLSYTDEGIAKKNYAKYKRHVQCRNEYRNKHDIPHPTHASH